MIAAALSPHFIFIASMSVIGKISTQKRKLLAKLRCPYLGNLGMYLAFKFPILMMRLRSLRVAGTHQS
jgi:hypothetical protein